MHNIALLQGGTSSEREISLRSAVSVASALRAIGHDVTAFTLESDSIDNLPLEDFSFVFICLHGGWGENGGVQAALEARGIPYSGSDAVSSRLAMSKELTKAKFLNARVPTATYDVATERDAEARLARMAARCGFPLAIKPTCEGSSVGVTIARNMEEARAGLKEAFRFGKHVMIERGIVGRELTVGIIDERAYPVIEIAPGREFYDYQAKYVDTGTRYIDTPDLSEAQERLARHFALQAHRALRCHGYSRVDLMLGNDGQLWVLEVNTLPGMTDRSLLPLATRKVGMSYEETLQAMVDASLESRLKGRAQSNRLHQSLRMAG